RAPLLGEARHVHDRCGLALDVRRHRQQGADGDDARAADAVDQDAVRLGRRRLFRNRQQHAWGSRLPSFRVSGLPLARGRAVNGDEARTEAVQAREVLVAGRLVDGALAPELGLDRHDGDAVRFDAAVAAAFADQLVDEHALRRIRHAAALAAAALLGGTGLVVDDGGDAHFLAQLTLHPVQRLSVLDPRVGRQGDVLAVLLWLVA